MAWVYQHDIFPLWHGLMTNGWQVPPFHCQTMAAMVLHEPKSSKKHIGDMCSNAINLISCEEGITWWSHYGHSVIVIDHHRSTKPRSNSFLWVVRTVSSEHPGATKSQSHTGKVSGHSVTRWRFRMADHIIWVVALLFVCELALDQNIWYQKCFPPTYF